MENARREAELRQKQEAEKQRAAEAERQEMLKQQQEIAKRVEAEVRLSVYPNATRAFSLCYNIYKNEVKLAVLEILYLRVAKIV